MLKALSFPELLLLATVGSLICGAGAMVFEKGYRRGPVGLGVVFSSLVMVLPWLSLLVRDWGNFQWFAALLAGCMGLASVFMVPLLTFAGLTESDIPRRTRLCHAALVLSAWIVGPGLVALYWVGDLH
jgi:hypothetical protein